MNTDLSTPIDRLRQHLDEFCANALGIAETIADEAWDHFETEIEQITENGIDFELLAAAIRLSLCRCLSMAYEQAFAHHVIARYERLCANLAQDLGQGAIDTAHIDLANMRKGIKLQRHAQVLIEQAISRAKPGIGRMLGVAVGSLFRDPLEHLDTLEKDMQENARRLRNELLDLRQALRMRMAEDSQSAMLSARLEINRQLDLLGDLAQASSPADAS